MRLLLDTHVFLWVVSDDPRLPADARREILDADEVFVSAASIWEIAIKAQLGKIHADAGEVARAIQESGFLELCVTARHAAHVQQLPPHHRDPFDRLLVAQAMTEPLLLLTADLQLAPYSDLVKVIRQSL